MVGVTSNPKSFHIMNRPTGPRKILITGGAGFIGRHLVQACLMEGWQVVVVDDGSAGRIEALPPEVTTYGADVRDWDTMRKIFCEERPQLVSHHAALVNVRESNEFPQRYLEVNAGGTASVLRAALEAGAEKLILASSGGAVYGNVRSLPIREDHPLHPLSPYGVSKVQAERLLQALNGRLTFVILRYGNIYGPGQGPQGKNGVVSILADALLRGDSPRIFGDGRQRRDFVYVADAVQAHLLAMGSEVKGVFNIGTGHGSDVNEILRILRGETGVNIEPVKCAANEFEVRDCVLDSSRARQILGWEPHVPLEAGIGKTWAWIAEEDKVRTSPMARRRPETERIS
jgi:UDP-glucose 4-epimerase